MSEPPILWCTACGASTKVVNKTSHERNCRRGPVAWTTINPHKSAAPDPTSPAKPDVANVIHMANEPANAPGLNRASPTYRYRNPTKRRVYMRNLMRRRRATGRAA
jgi:hypothetical protein